MGAFTRRVGFGIILWVAITRRLWCRGRKVEKDTDCWWWDGVGSVVVGGSDIETTPTVSGCRKNRCKELPFWIRIKDCIVPKFGTGGYLFISRKQIRYVLELDFIYQTAATNGLLCFNISSY